MGYYVNPPGGMTKKQWLETNGERASVNAIRENYGADNTLPVCLIENGWMDAACIAYNTAEFEECADTRDTRPKRWFVVNKKLLEPWYRD